MAAAADERAADRVLRPLLKPGYRLAYMMLGDREAAEDAVQEAALKSWRKLPQLREGSDPQPWFLGFVANECRNMRRSRWRSVLTLGERDDLVAPHRHQSFDPDLSRALARLGHDDRLVVLLRFYFDMPVEQIAKTTRWRAGAVRSKLHRAIKRLKSRLAVEDATNG